MRTGGAADISADAPHGPTLAPRALPARDGETLHGGAERVAAVLPHHLRLVVRVPAHGTGRPGQRARATALLSSSVHPGQMRTYVRNESSGVHPSEGGGAPDSAQSEHRRDRRATGAAAHDRLLLAARSPDRSER